MIPSFICIGAQRSGTTWLHECLNEHPQLFLPEKKELHFFNSNFHKGLSYYESFFVACDTDSGKLPGEITPNYYHDRVALSRLKDAIPNVKLIFIIREPVARAYSHYQLSLTNQCKGMTFDEAMKKVPIITLLSKQGLHLEHIFSLFSREQVHVCFYDDIEHNPLKFYQEILDFLLVDRSFTPEKLQERVNRIVYPKLQQNLAKLGLTPLVDVLKASPIGRVIKKNYNRSGRHKVNDFKKVYGERFIDDILNIERMLDVDLSHWR